MLGEYNIGLQGNYYGGIATGSGAVPFGRGFAGQRKRIQRMTAQIADYLFETEAAKGLVASLDGCALILTGTVESESAAAMIKSAMSKIPGVTDVQMAVQVGKQPALGIVRQPEADV